MSHVSQVHVECQAGYTFIVEARFPSGDTVTLGHTSSGQITDTTFTTADKKGETFEIWAGGAGVVDRWGFDSPITTGDLYYVYDPDSAGKLRIVGKGQAGIFDDTDDSIPPLYSQALVVYTVARALAKRRSRLSWRMRLLVSLFGIHRAAIQCWLLVVNRRPASQRAHKVELKPWRTLGRKSQGARRIGVLDVSSSFLSQHLIDLSLLDRLYTVAATSWSCNNDTSMWAPKCASLFPTASESRNSSLRPQLQHSSHEKVVKRQACRQAYNHRLCDGSASGLRTVSWICIIAQPSPPTWRPPHPNYWLGMRRERLHHGPVMTLPGSMWIASPRQVQCGANTSPLV
ncbi:hypothetical protein DOTSEDRAFT_39383 [Dothistroma septosporum NZE10]|uniref:Uncharacterized protein n=1 Tax=Dothistroma septosporum (strain NZE10 / CBS 128990) TaxID=675120 RepID=N1PBI3_DOTSN|nr:hypothetical protein DOTSEDRAFT_39383 [Dothistroma septosporum NZE10]